MSNTPGPWMLGGRHRLLDDENGEQWGYTVTAVGGTAVEQVLGSTFHVATVGANPGDAECEANARLIAAAPDLLSACRCALADLEGMCGLVEEDHPCFETIEELKAAIEKAEGGE